MRILDNIVLLFGINSIFALDISKNNEWPDKPKTAEWE